MPQLRLDEWVQLISLMTDAELSPEKGLIARIENWHLAGENMGRLALHVHGDTLAQTKGDELITAVAALRNNRDPMSLDALNDAVAAIGKAHGLAAYASNAKCFFDPLETVVDTSFYALPSE